MEYCANYRAAVGLFVGQGCERSELPCLSFGSEGARPKVLVCFPLNHGSLRGKARLKSRRMPIISPLSLVPLHASKANGNQDNHPPSTATITTNVKKTKAFGLVPLRHVPWPLYNGRFGMKTCVSNPKELTDLGWRPAFQIPKNWPIWDEDLCFTSQRTDRFGMKTCVSNPKRLTALELKICILNPKWPLCV